MLKTKSFADDFNIFLLSVIFTVPSFLPVYPRFGLMDADGVYFLVFAPLLLFTFIIFPIVNHYVGDFSIKACYKAAKG